jgi:hypothetical protein
LLCEPFGSFLSYGELVEMDLVRRDARQTPVRIIVARLCSIWEAEIHNLLSSIMKSVLLFRYIRLKCNVAW